MSSPNHAERPIDNRELARMLCAVCDRETRNVVSLSFVRDGEVEPFFGELRPHFGPGLLAQMAGR